MNFTRFTPLVLPLAFAGAAAALIVKRRYARLRDAEQCEEHLRIWEGEGGTSAPAARARSPGQGPH